MGVWRQVDCSNLTYSMVKDDMGNRLLLSDSVACGAGRPQNAKSGALAALHPK